MYLGPGRKIGPELLGQYEGHGYRLEEKIDGHWCCMEIGDDRLRFWSRLSNEILDERIDGIDLSTRRLASSLSGIRVVGELKDRHLYVFDWPYPEDAYLERKNHLAFIKRQAPWISLLPSYSKGFPQVYDSIIADGGEGVVLKHEESYYHSRRKDRKTGLWIKCKPEYSNQ